MLFTEIFRPVRGAWAAAAAAVAVAPPHPPSPPPTLPPHPPYFSSISFEEKWILRFSVGHVKSEMFEYIRIEL